MDEGSPYNTQESQARIELPPRQNQSSNDEKLGGDKVGTRTADLSFLSNNFSTDSIDIKPLEDLQIKLLNSPFIPYDNDLTHYGTQTPNTGAFFSQHQSPYNGAKSLKVSHTLKPLNNQQLLSREPSKAERPMSAYIPSSFGHAFYNEEAHLKTPKSQKRNSFHHQTLPSSFPTFMSPSSESRKPRSRSTSPVRSRSSRGGSQSPVRTHGLRGTSPVKTPFEFKPQDMPMMHSNSSNSSLVVKPAHRKGHRYKHSSVSMNLFQEPNPFADTSLSQEVIPSLYPIPNWKESWSSADQSQRFKIALATAHFLISILVFVTGTLMGEAAFSTLAHLVFYDSLGSFVLASVDVLSNFDVWKKPSISYPFGIGRLETLLGFGLSTSLVMVGCDLVSHFIEELVVNLAVSGDSEVTDHGSHHIHGDSNTSSSPILYEAVVALVVIMTWVTSSFISSGDKISEMLADNSDRHRAKKAAGYLDSLAGESPLMAERTIELFSAFLRNPMRLITLLYSTFLLISPIFPGFLSSFKFDIDEASVLIVASTLCYAGWKLVTTLGGILLISFPYSEYDYKVLKSSVSEHIQDLDIFKSAYSMQHLFITKVNSQLYIAGVKINMIGASADDESRMIFEVNRIFQNALKTFEKDAKVESTIDIDRF